MTRRSTWKGPYVKEEVFQTIFSSSKGKMKTTSRDTTILPFLLGKLIQVHNGKFFFPLYITPDMIGHKLGEFVISRLRHIYKFKKKKNGSKIKSK
jgi:small subunit ribosomal protein S19